MGSKAFCNNAKVMGSINAYINRVLKKLDSTTLLSPFQLRLRKKLLLPRTPEIVTALILAAISVSKHLKSFEASRARLLCRHLR